MIDASLFLFYVDSLLDWNPKSCGDDGSALNLDDFFYFFGECLKKNQNAPRPSEHAEWSVSGFGVCWTQIWDARASSRRWGILEFSHSRAIVA